MARFGILEAQWVDQYLGRGPTCLAHEEDTYSKTMQTFLLLPTGAFTVRNLSSMKSIYVKVKVWSWSAIGAELGRHGTFYISKKRHKSHSTVREYKWLEWRVVGIEINYAVDMTTPLITKPEELVSLRTVKSLLCPCRQAHEHEETSLCPVRPSCPRLASLLQTLLTNPKER